jgi:RNA polymerase sigma-70 factor (ECF subfamily)
LNQRALAEEVLQESYLSAWHHAANYNPMLSQPLTWLTNIARNKALDVVRSTQTRLRAVSLDEEPGAAALELADDRPEPWALLSEAADRLRLSDCLKELESRQRESVALAFYDGLSHAELAQTLQAPLGTVKAWVRRGLEKLKRCMEK